MLVEPTCFVTSSVLDTVPPFSSRQVSAMPALPLRKLSDKN